MQGDIDLSTSSYLNKVQLSMKSPLSCSPDRNQPAAIVEMNQSFQQCNSNLCIGSNCCVFKLCSSAYNEDLYSD